MSYHFGQADWFYGINKPAAAYQCPPGNTQIEDSSGIRCIAPEPVAPVTTQPPLLPGVLPAGSTEQVVYLDEEEDDEEEPNQKKIMVQNMIIVGGGIAALITGMLVLKLIF